MAYHCLDEKSNMMCGTARTKSTLMVFQGYFTQILEQYPKQCCSRCRKALEKSQLVIDKPDHKKKA